ncbi:MAG: TlpA family protein disulfide reductase, partial [Anaerolineae bacterium]|nr:TlpA family protein disulfide reductase [Anaerolineae bacterium]
GVDVVAVNFNESAEAVQAYLDDMALSLTAVLDPQGKISRQFGAYQLPITLFVDPEGVVRFKHIGALTFEALDDYLHHMAEDAGR